MGVGQLAQANGDVHPLCDQVAVRIIEQQLQAQLRMGMQQRSQRPAQRCGQAQHGGNAQLAHGFVALGIELGAGLARGLQHHCALRIKALPGVGQAEPARRAVHQRQARLGFQLPHLLADGRSTHAQKACSSRHRALLDHRGKNGHALEVIHPQIMKHSFKELLQIEGLSN